MEQNITRTSTIQCPTVRTHTPPACKKAKHARSRWYKKVYIRWLVNKFEKLNLKLSISLYDRIWVMSPYNLNMKNIYCDEHGLVHKLVFVRFVRLCLSSQKLPRLLASIVRWTQLASPGSNLGPCRSKTTTKRTMLQRRQNISRFSYLMFRRENKLHRTSHRTWPKVIMPYVLCRSDSTKSLLNSCPFLQVDRNKCGRIFHALYLCNWGSNYTPRVCRQRFTGLHNEGTLSRSFPSTINQDNVLDSLPAILCNLIFNIYDKLQLWKPNYRILIN